jgi:hypothetical protein
MLPDEVEVDDLYKRVTELAGAGQIKQAINIIAALDVRQQQIDIIYQLAHHLAVDHHFDHMLTLVRDLAHALDLDLALVRARNIALALGFARDLAVARAHGLNHELVRAYNISRVIVGVLEYLAPISVFARTVDESPTVEITLTGMDTLTPYTLTDFAAPYLLALADLQRVIAKLTKQPMMPPRLISLSEYLRLIVEIDGVQDAVNSVREVLIPWRKTHSMNVLGSDAKTEIALNIIGRFAPNLPETECLSYVSQMLNAVTVLIESPLELDIRG